MYPPGLSLTLRRFGFQMVVVGRSRKPRWHSDSTRRPNHTGWTLHFRIRRTPSSILWHTSWVQTTACTRALIEKYRCLFQLAARLRSNGTVVQYFDRPHCTVGRNIGNENCLLNILHRRDQDFLTSRLTFYHCTGRDE